MGEPGEKLPNEGVEVDLSDMKAVEFEDENGDRVIEFLEKGGTREEIILDPATEAEDLLKREYNNLLLLTRRTPEQEQRFQELHPKYKKEKKN